MNGRPLEEYRRKRNPAATPEPVPRAAPDDGPGANRSRRRRRRAPAFVIQEHHARSLHWDFRLEHDGVLVSWAVPKGLPADSSAQHLAVHTEDHPMEYLDFEGSIPEGEYGGGEVTVWDSGTYEELKWTEREVMVVLHGDRTGRAEGQFVLFRTRGKNWIIHRMGGPQRDYSPMPTSLRPMLAELGGLPARDDGWWYEFKWDGIRAVSYVDGGRIHIESRNGNDLSPSFPELRRLGEHLGSRQVVLDGEIVAFDDSGVPRFQLLQPRIHASDARKAKRLSESQPVTYIIFDLLYADGSSLFEETYAERRRLLESLGLEKGESWTVSPRFAGPGCDILQASKSEGLEGVVAKRESSPYRPGRRSPEWTKVKNVRTQEVVIGGWTPGQGRRTDQIGSLLVGIPDGEGGLAYVGQVGTGFSQEVLADLADRLTPLEAAASPFHGEIPARYRVRAHFVEPELVGEASFSEWTKDGRLRHPSWRGLREDKSPSEVVRES